MNPASTADRPICFTNPQPGASFSALRVAGGRIAAFDERPHRGDLEIDLEGDRLLPGLINAHDHLQLNSLPRVQGGALNRAGEWIELVAERRDRDPAFRRAVQVDLAQRLLIGGIKNLLSGVTTVAHHDPRYAPLARPDFPTGVLEQYGWSHSLPIDGPDAVRDSYLGTPRPHPWIIHAAEGIDPESAEELDRLDALGCLGDNTLLVHGVALDERRLARLIDAGAGLIWCPASNLELFGCTARVAAPIAAGRVALGSDSRLSGSRDLLDELCIAAAELAVVAGADERGLEHATDDGNVPRRSRGLAAPALEPLVTSAAARLLRLGDRGELRVGARADLVVLERNAKLGRTDRGAVRLVMIHGLARYATPAYAARVRESGDWSPVRVDGAPRMLDATIASKLRGSAACEPGLELTDRAWRVA